MFQKKKATKNRRRIFLPSDTFFRSDIAHGILRSPKVEAGRAKNRERPREKGRRSSHWFLFPFFSFFFFFFVVFGKSFLEQREREREREDILCAREKDLVLAIVVKNTFTCRWGARRRIRKPGRSCFRTRARRP